MLNVFILFSFSEVKISTLSAENLHLLSSHGVDLVTRAGCHYYSLLHTLFWPLGKQFETKGY